ncbi:hypothetical protein BJ322DRAFT_1029076 [Thelephora terrestris]|uniref:Protein phosphatase n=1 Tax=Thelephora terrestris TaxID=56493 RepID=A0A9P6HQ62_9AGAM|nr:hypothetical protein BJ322DRAFT_1029076 [Thelephora terrestris]
MSLPLTLRRYGHKTRPTRAKQSSTLLAIHPALRAFTTASTHTEQCSRPFRFVVGASWLGKPPGPKPRRSKYLPAAHPFDSKSPIGAWRDQTLEWPKGVLPANKDPGHDFFYIQPMMNNSGLSVGVADGVGGWDDVTNPALFSQALMYHCHRYAKRGWAGEPETDPTQGYEERQTIEGWELTPAQCLENAHTAVLREKGVVAGSSTATILNFNSSSGFLRTLNLGDSGFIIVRSSNIIYESVYQTHYFNCPMQLSKIPPNFGGAARDKVSDGHVFEIGLRDGDLVIAYVCPPSRSTPFHTLTFRQTDGLCDNVFASEMLALYTLAGRVGGSDEQQVQAVTDNFVHYARACMVNNHRSGPWAQRSTRAGMPYKGGKIDDVTVVAVLVRES